ncbi:MAG TPA: cation-transporting P-type ATPase [Candidatus Bathyarchaeia archaeon]|nr:cation-transporting P-type ATPase [Candidatus Bathyarchaeia archaeon]
MNISNKKLEFPGSIENGLAAEVQTQLAKYGFNEIPEKKTSFLMTFGKRFWGLVPWMLEITAILTFFWESTLTHNCSATSVQCSIIIATRKKSKISNNCSKTEIKDSEQGKERRKMVGDSG